MGAFIDTGDEIEWVPHANVVPLKEYKDGSNSFKLVGGPLHDQTIRVYGPFEELVFEPKAGFLGQHHDGPMRYNIHPPSRKNGKWVYVYTPNMENR